MEKYEFIKQTLVNLCVETNQIKVNPEKDTPIYFLQRKKAREYFGIPEELLNSSVNTFSKLYQIILSNNNTKPIN